MASTTTHLYRSVMGRGKKYKITIGEDAEIGILYPRFETTQYKVKDEVRTSFADLTVVMGAKEPEVLPDGGTSLHDVAGWFICPEFWIPQGTVYSEEINIRKDKAPKSSKTGKSGYHYQLEPRTRMTQGAFMGYLDNMARAAVVRQRELVGKKEPVETKK